MSKCSCPTTTKKKNPLIRKRPLSAKRERERERERERGQKEKRKEKERQRRKWTEGGLKPAAAVPSQPDLPRR